VLVRVSVADQVMYGDYTELRRELGMLYQLKHPGVVLFYGCCINPEGGWARTHSLQRRHLAPAACHPSPRACHLAGGYDHVSLVTRDGLRLSAEG
jgi:hypothetical protein